MYSPLFIKIHSVRYSVTALQFEKPVMIKSLLILYLYIYKYIYKYKYKYKYIFVVFEWLQKNCNGVTL